MSSLSRFWTATICGGGPTSQSAATGRVSSQHPSCREKALGKRKDDMPTLPLLLLAHAQARGCQAIQTVLIVVMGCSLAGPAVAGDAPPISRVRSTDTSIAAHIDRAARGSETFQRLLKTIQRSNGIVYIERGNCRRGARACLKLSVTANGPDRFLRILVDRRKADSDEDFMGSIGHELQHAIEALSQPSIRNGAQLYNFFKREAPTDDNRFDTPTAINVGDAVRVELRGR